MSTRSGAVIHPFSPVVSYAMVLPLMDEWKPASATSTQGSPESSAGPLSSPQLPPAVTSEIARYVQEALSKFGAPGAVHIEGAFVCLTVLSSQSTAPLGALARRWEQLDETSRRSFAASIARQLADLRPRPSEAAPRPRLIIDLQLVLAGVAVLAAIGYFIWFDGKPPLQHTQTANAQSRAVIAAKIARPAPDAAVARAARVCAETLQRVFRGGTVSVADVDGWVIEILLTKTDAKQRLLTHPALLSYVDDPQAKQGSKFIWSEEPDLASVETSDSVVRIKDVSLQGKGGEAVEALRFTFSGSLVDAYFRPETRARYFHVAHSLSVDLAATHAALYARCTGDDSHAIGGWFRGQDAGGAATALVQSMGMHARPRHVSTPFYKRPGEPDTDPHYAFENIVEHTQVVDRKALATLVGSEGGMATGKPGDAVIITFPFRDGNRASRVSRSLARVTSLGH